MDRWIDRPVLAAVWESEQKKIEDPSVRIEYDGIAQVTGIDERQVIYSLEKLRADGWIDGVPTGQGVLLRPRITPDGLRALEVWPSDNLLAEALPAILERIAEALESAGEPEKASESKMWPPTF